MMARLALWDVSREGHLDLERPLAGGGTLAELFAGKAIVILDRPFDGPGGPISPRDLLDPDQALRAAATGLDLALIGDGPGLRDLLTPSPTATGTATDVADDRAAALGVVARGRRALVPVFRRFPLLRWRRPTAAWLSAQAERLSAALAQALPTQRHLVIHRFEPERVAGGWRGALWRVGTLETVRTLDADAGAMVHAAGTPSTGEATLAMLVALDFDQQLERLRWTLADPGATLGALTAIVDALVIDVASELEVINRPGRRRGASADDLAAALPRLHALGHGVGTTALDTPGGVAVVDLASRIASFAASQVDWLDRLPPWRWWRRAPATARLATAALEALVASVFAPDEQAAARAAIAARVAAHRQAYRVARRGLGGAGRRAYGLRAALAPLASDVVTADIELLTSAAERVVTGDAYDDVLAEREAAAARRARVVDALAAERAALGA
ncbi:MAG: hypothetical protein IPL61_14015 [Myxococcales bacterium]|nr:hypothetical protein [Myxococcales bacterium]